MTKSEEFLAQTNFALIKKLRELEMTYLEETGTKATIFRIFKKHHDIDEIFYQLKKYLRKSPELYSLLPEIKNLYQQFK